MMKRFLHSTLRISPLLAVFLLGWTVQVQAAFVDNLAGGTLTLTQTVDDGNVTVDNNGIASAFRIIDGSGTTEYVAATNVVVNMLSGTGNMLDFDLDNAHAGFATLNLGDGTRSLNLTGSSNSVDGDLTITGGSGDQTVEVAVNAGLAVGGMMSVDLGTGYDTIDEDNNDIAITGDLNFTNVNDFENGGTMAVGGSVVVDVTTEAEDTRFDDDATMTIGGNFTYNGGNGRDEITMNGVAAGTSVTGFASIDVGDNTIGGVQFIFFNLPNASVGDDLTVVSTSSVNIDSFSLHPGASMGGNVYVDLGGGSNDANFSGTIAGPMASYLGGSGTDTVFVGVDGPNVDFIALLGDGSDTFSLGSGTSLASLEVDFGCNDDTFIDGLGTPPDSFPFADYPFPFTFLNLLDEQCTPPIPTMNSWALALMAGLLALLGFTVLARRQRA